MSCISSRRSPQHARPPRLEVLERAVSEPVFERAITDDRFGPWSKNESRLAVHALENFRDQHPDLPSDVKRTIEALIADGYRRLEWCIQLEIREEARRS